jgi:MFS family permease
VPTIVADLGDSSGYTWIGTSYLLARSLSLNAFTDISTVPLPLYGKASDIWGRKPILFVGIGFFELGSALCGASQNMKMLIASRVIQGIGGGGIMGLVNIIITDIISLRFNSLIVNPDM